MTSYISAFRPVFLVLLMIAAIEASLALASVPEPYIGGLYSHQYLSGDVPQKRFVNEKIRLFKHTDAEFIQVGDSSGLNGVQPYVVERTLGSHHPYINGNCCGDTGYAGYRYLAETFLRHAPRAKYLVFYTTPLCVPSLGREGLSRSLYRALISPFRFVEALPSLHYRIAITNLVYYGTYSHLMFDNMLSSEVIKRFSESKGWYPAPASPKREVVPTDECDFDPSYNAPDNPTLKPELEKLKAVADKYHVKLILLFNPVACTAGPKIKPLVDDLNDFLQHHPDVIMPLPYITTINSDAFANAMHLSEEASVGNSERVGKALARVTH